MREADAMSDLRTQVRAIQRGLGVRQDGVFGPVTAAGVLAAMRQWGLPLEEPKEAPARVAEETRLDARSERTIATLDPKARPAMRRFLCLAKATAATLGCDYVGISGLRTWDEQDRIYQLGRRGAAGEAKVTNARGGHSWHNFGVALDCGVFRGGQYLDEADRALAAQVHRVCAVHARRCGLTWGGDWKQPDLPHYQVPAASAPGAAERAKFKLVGSVL